MSKYLETRMPISNKKKKKKNPCKYFFLNKFGNVKKTWVFHFSFKISDICGLSKGNF